MARLFSIFAIALVVTGQVGASEITGSYVESRTCDVWTGPCFANADFNITGKDAVMAWKIDRGSFNQVDLQGLSIVAAISASDTLGLQQTGPAKAVVIVDSRANESQRKALIEFARRQAGGLLDNVVAVQSTDVQMNICDCDGETCAELNAGNAKIKTRCLHTGHDKVCGNESAYHPPLAQGVNAKAAATVENSYTGRGLGHTWQDFNRRGSYVGTFLVRE